MAIRTSPLPPCFLLSVTKAPAKRSQHFNSTYRNIARSNILLVFDLHVATWCDILQNVGCCCSRLARFMQQCCAWAYTLVRFLTRNMSQHVATRCNRVPGQTRATCCAQQCCDMLRSNVAIVLPGLANAEPTKM